MNLFQLIKSYFKIILPESMLNLYREYDCRKRITATYKAPDHKNVIKSLHLKGKILWNMWREWSTNRKKFNRGEIYPPDAYMNPRTGRGGYERSKKHQNRRLITFFFSDLAEYQSVQPIAQVAYARGYKPELTMDVSQKVDIGVYCNHRPDSSNSSFSVVMLHQIGQDQWPECPSIEPNAWSFAPWDAFDIGVLPGRASSQCWYSVSEFAYSRPRLGVFELGNPKSDRIFRDNEAFNREVIQLKKTLGLKNGPTVLYAPSYTSEEKQDDFIQSLQSLPFNLLIKHYPWKDPDNKDRISKISEKFQGMNGKGVHTIEPEIDIMTCLALSDVVVSDNSNCLVEALLFDVPGISVMDWIIPPMEYFGKIIPARIPKPPPCAIKTTRAELRTAVKDTIQKRDQYRARLRQYRAYYYSHLGHSSELTMDVIDAALSGDSWPIEPLLPKLSALFYDAEWEEINNGDAE